MNLLRLIAVCLFLLSCSKDRHIAYRLNYDEMILLDAENLAERGIKEAYDALVPRLRRFVENPVSVAEQPDPRSDRYVLRYNERCYLIYGPDTEDAADSWRKATFVLFHIVNDQMSKAQSSYRFYAISGGNDLGGMFLTAPEWEMAKRSLPRADWPHIPSLDTPFYATPC